MEVGIDFGVIPTKEDVLNDHDEKRIDNLIWEQDTKKKLFVCGSYVKTGVGFGLLSRYII